jgi:hypothetical protein
MTTMYILKNLTRKHSLKTVWVEVHPHLDYVKDISKTLGWNLSTDVVISTSELSWANYKDGAWESHTFAEANPPELSESDIILDADLDMYRDDSGFLVIDDELLYKKHVQSEDPKENIRQCFCA